MRTRRVVSLDSEIHVDQEPAPHVIPYTLGFTVLAPRRVPLATDFTVVVTPDPITFDPRFSTRLWDLHLTLTAGPRQEPLRCEVPAAASARPPVRTVLDGDRLTIAVAGPVAAGQPLALPAVTLTLTAAAEAVEVRLAGTSFAEPGWGYRFEHTGTGLSGAARGRPGPGQGLLARTTTHPAAR